MNFSAPTTAGPTARMTSMTPVEAQKRIAASFSSSPQAGARIAELSSALRRRASHETPATPSTTTINSDAPESRRVQQERERPAR